ncbi:MAG: hypothetical protein H6719_15390 [Sandaracinaceae bacterium]|nr:hypothetical protein [Sandaracinaceae bacterium]
MPRMVALVLLLPLASCTSCGRVADVLTRDTAGPEPLAAPPPQPAGALPARPDGPPRVWSPLGTNLDGPFDWSEANPFIDAFRLSRGWTSAPAEFQPDDEQPIDVDEHGWIRSLGPHQIVRTGVLWDVRHVRGGRYSVLWDGDGELATHGGAHRHIVEQTPGRMIVDWDPERDGLGFGLTIVRTDPADPVRNIRVIPPGGACREDPARFCEQSGDGCACLSFLEHHEALRFHPDFLATLGSYGVLRFMNWQMTNGSEEATWDDRPRVDDARWSDHGVPPEVLIDLANRLDAHPWLCVPHRADDGYARELGRLVRAQLDPALTVRVELSNEVWNGIFPQWEHARQEGLRLGLGGPERDLTLAQAHWQARRSIEVWRAFDQGFGDRSRTVHVLGGFVFNPWLSGVMLDFETTARDMDELAIAPYFGSLYNGDQRDEVVNGGVSFVLDDAERTLDEVLQSARENAELARPHGRLVAYEGGQHVVAVGELTRDEEAQAILRAANRDPRMGQLYWRYLHGWREVGGTLMVHFVNAGGWNDYGSWGALEYARQDPTEAPKALALERFARTTRPWW